MKKLWYLFCLVSVTLYGAEPAKLSKPTAEEVIRLWSPKVPSATEFAQTGSSPKEATNVAAYSFQVTGPTFEELWTHYAKLCGLDKRFEEKTFLITGNDGPNGSYVIADRPSGDGKGGRGLSVFLLKTDDYTVTVTFHPEPEGNRILGSLTAVTPP